MDVASVGRQAPPGADESADETAPTPARKGNAARPSVRERSEAFEAQKRYMQDRYSYHRPGDVKPQD